MKVVCVNSDNVYDLVTFGKEYEMNSYGGIIDNFGNSVSLFSWRFKTLAQVREDKLNEILNESSLYK
jgi:hypothetical protein